jgi:hypothetical protein
LASLVGKNGKLDKFAMQGVVWCLKELLPLLDLLKTLMGLTGCLVAKISLHLHDGPHRFGVDVVVYVVI